MAIEYERHLWSADDYQAMIAAGILGPDDRVELLGGEIVEMAPIGPPHSFGTTQLTAFFVRRLGDDAVVLTQGPIRLDDFSVPEPDVAVLRPGPRRYERRYPGPEDIILAVEVADSSLRRDRLWKLPFYARAGIREVWLVDVNGQAVERYTRPGPDGYEAVERFERGTFLAFPGVPDVQLQVDEILPSQDEH